MKGQAFFPRLISQVLTFFVFLAVLCVIVGATGFSDKILRSVVNEELRSFRQSLAVTVKDPKELQRIVLLKQKELEHLHGLDQPWIVRVPKLMSRIIQFDWGNATVLRSNSGSSKISEIIKDRLPNTVLLMTTSFFLIAVIGITVGVRTATRAGSAGDRALAFFAALTNSLPAWWLAIILIILFAVMWPVLPHGGLYSSPPPHGAFARFLDEVKHAVLPILSLTLVSVGPYIYQVRQMTLKTAQEPFVMFARAQGLPERVVRWKYVLRPSAPPIITGLGFGLTASFGGAILTETVFNWPGMGRLYFEALIGTPDVGLILVLTIIFGALFMITRFLLDTIYLLLDPRIRYR